MNVAAWILSFTRGTPGCGAEFPHLLPQIFLSRAGLCTMGGGGGGYSRQEQMTRIGRGLSHGGSKRIGSFIGPAFPRDVITKYCPVPSGCVAHYRETIGTNRGWEVGWRPVWKGEDNQNTQTICQDRYCHGSLLASVYLHAPRDEESSHARLAFPEIR